MNIEKQVEKAVGNKRAPKLNDKVLHRLSGVRGTVTEIGMVEDQHIVSVESAAGKMLSKLNWREVSLDSAGFVNYVSAPDPVIMELRDPPGFSSLGLEGPISGESLLGELV